MIKKVYLILTISIIIAVCIVIYGFSIGLSNADENEVNITINNTANLNESANTKINNEAESAVNVPVNNKEHTSSKQEEDDPFSGYSEDIQAQAHHYKSTHNHYSDDDNVVAHEYLSDGNARIYFGDGRSEVVPAG